MKQDTHNGLIANLLRRFGMKIPSKKKAPAKWSKGGSRNYLLRYHPANRAPISHRHRNCLG